MPCLISASRVSIALSNFIFELVALNAAPFFGRALPDINLSTYPFQQGLDFV